MCRLYGKFASYLRRVLCKTRLTFPRINGPIKYGLVQGFNFIVNPRTESCLQDVEQGHEETVYLGSTLGLIFNCFVKHYGFKFLISESKKLFA